MVRGGLLGVTLVFGLVTDACSLRTDPPPGAKGAEIYVLQNCHNCHGERREGNSRGPALQDLGRHWTRDTLARFLADPAPFLERDERLQALRRPYSDDMSRYDNLTEEERERLAEHLLGP